MAAETIEQYLNERDYIDPEHSLIARQAWNAAIASVSANSTSTNSAIVQLLYDCQDVICHSVFLDEKGHSALMGRINAVVAQLNQ